MLTAEGPKLIEYNCRFGDPECQVLMARFEGDLAALMLLAAQRRLHELDAPPAFADDAALTVVMAAKGYPGTPEKGGTIAIGETGPVKVFHAGTALKDGALVANGGRVLNVTATAPSVGAGARRGLSRDRRDRLSGRILSPRHRLARSRARGLTAAALRG